MTDTPRRFKARDELTIDEEVRVQQAERRGDPEPRFETDEYQQARSAALEEAGLEPEEAAAERSLEEMTPEDHFNRIQGR